MFAPLALAALALAAPCPVTLPNGSTPPGERPSPDLHGNGQLWVALPHSGVFDAPQYVRPDGSVDVKFPIWRAVRGRLVLRSLRLDGAAPPGLPDIPEGYGPTGFQASGIRFPTSGCWQVTARAGPGRLAFVLLITVGRQSWPVPLANLSAARTQGRRVFLRWLGNETPGVAYRYDVALRRAHGRWRAVRSGTFATKATLRPARRGRYEARVRARDVFAPGPWSPAVRFSLP